MSVSGDPPPKAGPQSDPFAARWRFLVLVVIVLAFALRIIAAIVVDRQVTQAGREFFVEGDANGYWDLGQDIARGGEYSVHSPPRRVLRVPGFPLLLAASIRIFGDSVFAARCVLAVVGTVCCWLTYLLGSRLVMRRVGFWAALMMAVHPWQIGNSVLILSETWFTFWMLLSLLALVRVLEGDEVRQPSDSASPLRPKRLLFAAVTGLLIAAAVLVRPGFLPWLVVALAVVSYGVRRSPLACVLAAGGLVLGFVLGMVPWVVRNYEVTGHLVLTSLWSGPSLYDGLNPEATGESDMTFFDRDQLMTEMSEYDMNAHYQRLAVEFAVDQPGRVVELAGRKLRLFLQPVPNSISAGWAIWAVSAAVAAIFAALIVNGIRSRLLSAADLAVLVGPFVLFLLVHMVFVGSLRYRLPTEFPLSVLAATGLRQFLVACRSS